MLRARDKVAPLVVRLWAEIASLAGASDAKTAEAYMFAAKMEKWQKKHGSKVPD